MMDLQILLLGPPEVRLHDKTIDIQRRTPRALLFYLASQGGLVGRDEILPLFWENESDYYARRRLSDTLSRLRASLPVSNLLLVESDLVGLDFQRVFVDQVSFLEFIDQAGRMTWQIPPSQPLPEQARESLAWAAGLWRSPHFLAGANLPGSPALDEWLTRTTQRMELLLVRVLERLALHAQATGDQEQALEFTRRALALDDLNEDLNYLLLKLLTDLGRINEAREHFSSLELTYQQEYDDMPPPQLAQFSQRSQRGPQQPGSVEVAPTWNVRPTLKVPFVGRRNILEQLQRRYVNGGGALILGESGQGKTRLIQEFSDRVAPPARLLLATCRPAESNLSFQPFIELLRNDIASEEWMELPDVWVRQLTLLLPELSSTRSGLQRPLSEPASEIAPGQARSQILEAIRQVFLAISRERRLILCLDDAHWSDEATLSTVGYLLERPPFDHQVFFLAAARREEENPYLQALITTLQQSSRLQVIHLARLSDAEISELASHMLGYFPSGQLTRLLSIETGGNPFILLESLRSLLEKGPLSNQPLQIPLAQSVQGLISARLQKVSPSARKILDAAAIIGGAFNTEIIHDVTQETPHQIVDALEELERHQLIEPVATASDVLAYHLCHEKIRETILSEMSPLRAQLLHRQVDQARGSSRDTVKASKLP